MGIRILIPRPKRRLDGVRSRRFLWLAGAAAIWGMAYSVFDATGLVGVYRAEDEVARLEEKVAEAEQVNEAMRAQVDALRSDPLAIEEEARERLGLVRDSDKVYLLPTPSPVGAAEPASPFATPDSPAAEATRRP